MGILAQHRRDSMILVIGEILYDLFPSYKRIGGAPFNFAFHLKKLGFDVRFVSRIGRDDLGKSILDFISSHGFDPADIQMDDRFPTGRVEVTMAENGSHSFSIIENTSYDHIQFDDRLKQICASQPKMVYYGTLIQRTHNGFSQVRALLDGLPPGTRKFCDVNLRPKCWTRDVVDQSIAGANILKLSHEELDVLVPDTSRSIEKRATALLTSPGPEQIILTRGKKGSIWVSAKGVIHARSDENRAIKIADTVGAGDAYAAMAAGAGLCGLGDSQAMAMAHEFAAKVCEIQGALPRDSAAYTHFLSRLSHDQ